MQDNHIQEYNKREFFKAHQPQIDKIKEAGSLKELCGYVIGLNNFYSTMKVGLPLAVVDLKTLIPQSDIEIINIINKNFNA